MGDGVEEAQETIVARLIGRGSRAYGTANDNKYVKDLRAFAVGVA